MKWCLDVIELTLDKKGMKQAARSTQRNLKKKNRLFGEKQDRDFYSLAAMSMI